MKATDEIEKAKEAVVNLIQQQSDELEKQKEEKRRAIKYLYSGMIGLFIVGCVFIYYSEKPKRQ